MNREIEEQPAPRRGAAESAEAADDLFPLLYEELRRIARRQLRGQQPGHTLSTTALVHEAYVKLASRGDPAWSDRAHFLGIAARAMRQVLVDYARKHCAGKRGGDLRRIPLEEAEIAIEQQAESLLVLDHALDRLSALNERLSRVVECRFFGAMTEEETAQFLGVTERTVRRDWVKARAWLYGVLQEEPT